MLLKEKMTEKYRRNIRTVLWFYNGLSSLIPAFLHGRRVIKSVSITLTESSLCFHLLHSVWRNKSAEQTVLLFRHSRSNPSYLNQPIYG